MSSSTFSGPVTSLAGFLGPKTIVNTTDATLSVTSATHSNAIVTLNRAGGIAVTLPAATGSGNVFEFIIGTTFTTAGTIKVASSTDFFVGNCFVISDNTAAVLGYIAANSGTVATNSDTITLTATGGYIGGIIRIVDIATATFSVLMHVSQTGTEASPFSATV